MPVSTAAGGTIPGHAAVYLADSLALAAMELLVHLGSVDVLRTYRKMPVSIPEDLVMHIDAAALPLGWETGPRTETRAIGDQWLSSQLSVALQVPSAVVPTESNFVINPNHPNFDALRVGPISDFRFDPRLAT